MKQPLRILVVLGEGGHTRQMLRLLDQLGPSYDYHYLIAEQDRLSEGKIRFPGEIYQAGRPRTKVEGKTDSSTVAAWQTMRSTSQLWPTMRQIRPDVVLANGPSIAVPPMVLGKLLGARIVWLESASRVFEMSTSGRIVYRFSDLFFVQWPQLQDQYPRAIYAGRLV
ncbi:MAG: PssD/Cps14F family polysaccharide biosynthesis glycosyltransferase [Chloroflexota bacterium]|nr:PssD/Cps14F family polysaccharide biosynthesis glycosyltransferase [Chloroflexota bacterium]